MIATCPSAIAGIVPRKTQHFPNVPSPVDDTSTSPLFTMFRFCVRSLFLNSLAFAIKSSKTLFSTQSATVVKSSPYFEILLPAFITNAYPSCASTYESASGLLPLRVEILLRFFIVLALVFCSAITFFLSSGSQYLRSKRVVLSARISEILMSKACQYSPDLFGPLTLSSQSSPAEVSNLVISKPRITSPDPS